MSWKANDAIRAALARPIAFHPVLARICGGDPLAGLFLSQALYWMERASDGAAWFYKTAREWEEETCIGRHSQDRLRSLLEGRGFLECKVMGVPATVHFRVDLDAVVGAVAQFAGKRQTSLPETDKLRLPEVDKLRLPESGKLDCHEAANMSAGKRQTSSPESGKLYKETESTSETTRERSKAGAQEKTLRVEITQGSDGKRTPTAETAWDLICRGLKATIDRHSFDTWIKPLSAVALEDGVLHVSLPVREFNVVAKKYRTELHDIVVELDLKIHAIQFAIGAQA